MRAGQILFTQLEELHWTVYHSTYISLKRHHQRVFQSLSLVSFSTFSQMINSQNYLQVGRGEKE